MSLSVETIVLKIVLKSSRKILIAFWKICHSLRMCIYIYIYTHICALLFLD